MSFFDSVASFFSSSAPPASNASSGSFTGQGGVGGPKIWPLSPPMREEMRKGVFYNMKVVLRGMRGTGKSTLLARFCGHQIPSVYTPSQEITASTIRIRGSGCQPHEGTKVDIWDVVDEGSTNIVDRRRGGGGRGLGAGGYPVPSSSSSRLKEEALEVLAMVADARSIDVYQHCQLAMFLIDCTRPATFSYAVREAQRVPPTTVVVLVLSFLDLPREKHQVSEADVAAACARLPRATSPLLAQVVGSRPPPPAFSTPALHVAVSVRTGFGLQELARTMDTANTLLRIAAVEARVRQMYQSITRPPSGAGCSTAPTPQPTAEASDGVLLTSTAGEPPTTVSSPPSLTPGGLVAAFTTTTTTLLPPGVTGEDGSTMDLSTTMPSLHNTMHANNHITSKLKLVHTTMSTPVPVSRSATSPPPPSSSSFTSAAARAAAIGSRTPATARYDANDILNGFFDDVSEDDTEAIPARAGSDSDEGAADVAAVVVPQHAAAARPQSPLLRPTVGPGRPASSERGQKAQGTRSLQTPPPPPLQQKQSQFASLPPRAQPAPTGGAPNEMAPAPLRPLSTVQPAASPASSAAPPTATTGVSPLPPLSPLSPSTAADPVPESGAAVEALPALPAEVLMARLDGVVHDTAGPSEDFFQDLPTAANEEEGKEQEEQEATVAPDEPIPPPTSSATEGVAKEEERERGAIGQPATRTLKPLTTQRRGAGATTTVTRGAAVGEHTTEASSEGRLTASGIGGTTAASVPVLQVDVAALLQGMEAALQQLNTTPAGAPVVTDSVTPEEEQSTSAGDSKRPRHRKHGHTHERDGASGRHRRKKRGSDGKPSKVETPHGPPLSSAEDEVADDGSFEVMEA